MIYVFIDMILPEEWRAYYYQYKGWCAPQFEVEPKMPAQGIKVSEYTLNMTLKMTLKNTKKRKKK